MTTDYWRLDAVDAALAVRNGDLSATLLVESHLARLDAVNGALNAVTIDTRESALEAAEAADRAVVTGRPLGPLHGVPVTIKENVDVAGQPTTNGLTALKDMVVTEDSPVVSNLKRAGAVVIGRTNTPEFSLRWFTDNELRGETVNPWRNDVTCGGSSGGAGSSVAAGIGAIAHGNDLGGSLRYPAYCCGVATIRPTIGRIPAWNPAGAERTPATQLMSVQGPIARSIADVRLALAAMSAADDRDPLWKPVPLENATHHRLARVGICEDPFGDGVDPAVAAAVRQAGDALTRAGYDVQPVELPEVEAVARLWGELLTSEIRTVTLPLVREIGSSRINAVLDEFLEAYRPLDLAGYLDAMMERNRLIRAWSALFDDCPVVLCPVSTVPPMPPAGDVRDGATLGEALVAQRPLVVANLLGLPAATVATGHSDGIPAGVQLIGPRYREDLCLDAAAVIEDDLGRLSNALWASMDRDPTH